MTQLQSVRVRNAIDRACYLSGSFLRAYTEHTLFSSSYKTTHTHPRKQNAFYNPAFYAGKPNSTFIAACNKEKSESMVATVGNKKRDTLYSICAPRDLKERSLPNVRLQEAYNHASTKKRYTECKRNYTVRTLIVNDETYMSFASEQQHLRAMRRLQDRYNKVLLLTTCGRVFPNVDK